MADELKRWFSVSPGATSGVLRKNAVVLAPGVAALLVRLPLDDSEWQA